MTPANTWENIVQSGQGIVLATLERVDSAGIPWVHWPEDPPAAARITRAVTADDLRRAAENNTPVVVICEGGDRTRPIILAVLATGDSGPPTEPPVEARVDGRTVTLTGQEEVTLRCGQASITLTKAGKILLRGAYVSSRSSGVNTIKGASVQIN